MDTALKSKLVGVWQRILRTDPDKIFINQAERLLRENWGDEIPQPGFVGENFQPGGLVFVSMNPGRGEMKGLGPGDRQQYKVLQQLRDAEGEDSLRAFDELTRVLVSFMYTWKIYIKFAAPILNCTNRTLTDIAYVNLLKWRTKKSSGLNRLYDLSWHDHTRDQIETLDPGAVIAIGRNAGKAFARHYSNNMYFKDIPRVIGNNIGPEGREAIREICSELQRMEKSHGR